MQPRKTLEAEADRLGVPWTHATTDAELHSLIQSRLRGGLMNAVEPEVKCHGEFWDFPKAMECKACPGQQSCFQRFSQVTFPAMQETLGPNATLSQLAKALDVSEEAVLVAKNAQAAPFAVPEVPADLEPEEIEKAGEVEEVGEPAEEEAEQLGLVEELGELEELNLADADEMEDELMALSEPEPEPEPPAELEMAASKKKKASKKAPAKKKKASAKKAPTKKASTAKAPPKKKKKAAKAPPPVSSEVQNPPPAESAKTATGSAKTKARAKNAPRAKGPAGPAKSGGEGKGKQRKRQVVEASEGPLVDPWGRHTWEDRYLRERKNKWISQLRPGMKLRREYKGEIHEVSVLKMFYRYKGELWPTLYTITKEITGTQEAPRQITKQGKRPAGTRQLCAWSAPKFFGLQALFSKR